MLEFDHDSTTLNERIIETPNNKIRLRRVDPFGFVNISYEKGQMPEHLKGNYTSFDEARKAVDVYLSKKKG